MKTMMEALSRNRNAKDTKNLMHTNTNPRSPRAGSGQGEGRRFPLTAIAAALLLGPQLAGAANECGVQAGTTPLVCNQAAYANGVSYTANGNLAVTFTPTVSNVGGNGVVLTATGTANVSFDSATTASELQSSNTVGALLDVRTEQGDIDIRTEEMDADGLSPAGVTHAIRAVSTGSGDISIVTTGAVDAASSANPANSVGIEARSSGGNIVINAPSVQGNQAAIRAVNTGGSVAVTSSGIINVQTTTGAIQIAEDGIGGGTLVSTSGDITGSVRGGITATSGTGDIDLIHGRPLVKGGGGASANDNLVLTTAGDIRLIRLSGGGNMTLNTSSGEGAAYVRVTNNYNNAGATVVGFGTLNATVGNGGLVMDIVGTGPDEGDTTSEGGFVRHLGGITASGVGGAEINVWRDAFFRNSANTPIGARYISSEFAQLYGTLNFSALQGGTTLNVGSGGLWSGNNGTSQFSPSDDVVEIELGGFMTTQIFNHNNSTPLIVVPNAGTSRTQVIDFASGDDRWINRGRMLVGVTQILINADVPLGSFAGSPRDAYEAELRLLNLETFENHGEIWLGTSYRGSESGTLSAVGGDPDQIFYAQGTDRVADDMLSMPGATFIGGETGRVFMDVNFSAFDQVQDRCDASIRDGGGNLPVADCINLQNGALEGRIYVNATATGFGGRGAYTPEGAVVVDLSDGNGGPGSGAGGAAGQVAFAPEMRYYNPAFGGVLDNGMFMSVFAYDEQTTQFKLATVPSGGAHHQPLIANGAQQAWRTAAGSFFDRQADLRDTLRAGQEAGRGVWLRNGYDLGERKAKQTFSTTSTDYVYDSAHDLETSVVTLGVDLIGGDVGTGAFVLGGMLGYVRTDMEYARFYTDTAAMNGMLVGAYGSYVGGPLFIDATVSGVWTRVDQDMPQAELFRDSLLSTDITTYGAQVEAGWRFDLGAARVEPLLSFSHVMTSVDDFKVPEDDPTAPGNQVLFDDTTSTRAGLGLRGSLEMPVFGDVKLGLSLTGRYQQELDGESRATIGNLNPISPEVVDEFDGNFSELMGGVTLANATGRVSGVLNIGSKFGDDYSALSGSFGFRYQW